MPNDSIGYDMRGKWLVPGTRSDIEGDVLPNPERWQPNAEVDLLILNKPPQAGAVAENDIHGMVTQGNIEIVAADP